MSRKLLTSSNIEDQILVFYKDGDLTRSNFEIWTKTKIVLWFGDQKYS